MITWKFEYLVIWILIHFFCESDATLDPCLGKSALNGTCDKDGDCNGFGLVCRSGQCQCHPMYVLTIDPDTKDQYCDKLPNTINAPCGTSGCAAPMFCQGNKCQCVRSRSEGNRCYAASSAGDTCTKDADCSAPFTFCYGGRCACVQGSVQSGSSCVASQQCPTGARPQGNCIRKSLNVQYIQNNVNSGSKADNCKDGTYCYAPEDSPYGFCCPQVCPMNSVPETKYTCDPTATVNVCPTATHYCHRSAGQSFSSTICCRSPCNGAAPLFVRGQCYPVAFYGSPCQINEQCDGGYGMTCSGGICRCSSGFVPYSDSYTTGENPPQTCVRDCGGGVSRAGECFTSSSLGSSCSVNEQCPSGAACFRGACFCDCRKGYIRSGSGCVQGQQTPKPVPAGSAGTATTKSGNVLDLLKGIFPGAGSG